MQSEIIDYKQYSDDYQIVEKAIDYLESNYTLQPSLEQVAASVGYSPYHFQRLFSRWVGISPKRFIQFLTKEYAKQVLDHSSSLLEVSLKSGMSGPGRLHDLFVNCEAVTPGEYRSRGIGLTIQYGFHATPFGECMIATTERGVCGLSFVIDADQQSNVRLLERQWPKAEIQESPDEAALLIERLFPIKYTAETEPLHLYLQGTNFQIKVWEALLRIPVGFILSYEGLAAWMERPKSVRAVSRALAVNPLAVVIPCHRVIRKMGAFGGYRWGTARKKAILGWEFARSES